MTIDDTIRGFKEIVEGKHDDMPEQAFYLVGTIDEAIAKAKTLKQARKDQWPISDHGVTDQARSCKSSRPTVARQREVDEVEMPGFDGYFGVLPGHTPLLARAAHRASVVPAG